MKITIKLGCNAQPKVFSSRKSALTWIIDGMLGTEGAEQDHYISLFRQLEEGRTTLDYWED